MLQLKCTAKVQALLKLKPTDLQPIVPSNTPLGDWFVNLLMIDRRKTLLFVNEKTASSFVIYGVKQLQASDFHILFLEGLLKFLQLQGVPDHKIALILPSYASMALTKTDSKQILGMMNDLVFHYDHHIRMQQGYKHCDLTAIIKFNNRLSFRNPAYHSPVQKLLEIVATL